MAIHKVLQPSYTQLGKTRLRVSLTLRRVTAQPLEDRRVAGGGWRRVSLRNKKSFLTTVTMS
jgi:hypothetical protein